LLLVPTFFMGGTLAVMGLHVIRRPQDYRRLTALLYGLNTAGAIIGAGLAAFVLIRWLGHYGATVAAAAVNLAIGLIAFWLGRHVDYPQDAFQSTRAKRKKNTRRRRQRLTHHLVFYGLGISGFCALAYQVLWTRLLILVVDNSIYSFSLILMVFLAGIALGSLAVSFIGRKESQMVPLFGLLQIGIAVAAFQFPFWIRPHLAAESIPYWFFLLVKMPFALVLPTLLMGMVFPLADALYQKNQPAVATSLGRVLGINTLGAVLGALAATAWLVPAWGFRNSLLGLAVINLLVGLAVLGRMVKTTAAAGLVAVGVLLVIAGSVLMPPDYFKQKYAAIEPQSRLVYYEEGLTATTTIFDRPDGNRILYLNGIAEVDTTYQSVATFKLMGALPGLLHPAPERALMVTFGAGITAGTATLLSRQVDCVDLADSAPRIAPFFGRVNDRVLDKPGLKLHIDDARHYLQNNQRPYHIIVSDATHPRTYDSWILFTQQFYRLVRANLTPDGIFCQWLPFHGLAPQQFNGIVNTFQETFTHTSLWRIGNAYTVLLATPQPLRIDVRRLAQRILLPHVRQNLKSVSLSNPFQLLSHFVLAEEQVKELTGSNAGLYTDNHPSHLFFPPRASLDEQYRQWPTTNFESIQAHEQSVIPFLVNDGDSPANRQKIHDRVRYYENQGS
jgi:spermidine synthase